MKKMFLVSLSLFATSALAQPADLYPGTYVSLKHKGDCAEGITWEVLPEKNDEFVINVTSPKGKKSTMTFPADVETVYLMNADKTKMEIRRRGLSINGEETQLGEEDSESFYEHKNFIEFEGTVGHDTDVFENRELAISGDRQTLLYSEVSGDMQSDPHEYSCMFKRVK